MSLLPIVLLLLLSVSCVVGAPITHIKIDGNFDDWEDVPAQLDPHANINGTVLQDGIPDTHDTDHDLPCDVPFAVYNPVADLLEWRFTHDEDSFFILFRAAGNISLTKVDPRNPGRSYIQIAIDFDNNVTTGYCLCTGGYYPTWCGYDYQAELEMWNGTINTGHVLLHAMQNEEDFNVSRLQQIDGYTVLAPASYHPYTEWVYWDDTAPMSEEERATCPDGPHKLPNEEGNAEICFVRDKIVKKGAYMGVIQAAFSADWTTLELRVPFRTLLKTPEGAPRVQFGMTIHINAMLETSSEFSTPTEWVSDGSWPYRGYVVEGPKPKRPLVGSVAFLVFILILGMGVGAAGLYIAQRISSRSTYARVDERK